MPLAIPLVDTVTAGDLLSIYDAVDTPTAPDALPPLLDTDIFILQRTSEANIDGKVYAEGDFIITGEELRQWVIGPNSVVRPWLPQTDYYGPYTDGVGVDHAGEIVSHADSLYNVLSDFTTGMTFADIDASTVVLSRITMDTDLQYVELPFSAVGPFLPNQTIGMYSPITGSVTVRKLWNLPNTLSPHEQDLPFSKFYCNPEITTNTVVTLYQMWDSGEQVVGTITFDPVNALTSYVPGDFDIGLDPDCTISPGDILIARVTTAAAELSWVSLNMLASKQSVRSPEFNIPV